MESGQGQENDSWVCNFCGKTCFSGAFRIKAHLAGVTSQGIEACPEVDKYTKKAAKLAWTRKGNWKGIEDNEKFSSTIHGHQEGKIRYCA